MGKSTANEPASVGGRGHGLLLRAFVLTAVLVCRAAQVHGHGLMYEPETRNYIAKTDGVDGQRVRGRPKKEYCVQCLNRNTGMCGRSSMSADYDEWVDSTGQPMPWESRQTYVQGQTIVVRSNLWAHHGGHMTVKACPKGRDSTMDCLEEYPLTFVRDLAYGMPADPNYPERGYYYGGAGWNGHDFVMEFKLPDNLVGTEVLLQWRYITANSCLPPGYDDYFSSNADHPVDPARFWNPSLGSCPWPLPENGEVSGGAPEQFFNCAEITIVPGEGQPPTGPTSPSPPSQPVAPRPTYQPTLEPTEAKPTDAPTSLRRTSNPTPVPRPVYDTIRGPKLVAYVGNWQPCPSVAQLNQYTDIMVAFAVSYTWNPNKNQCSSTCQIATPPICNGNPNIIEELHAAGKRVILSFGGAGMGGSWAGDNNDCWEDCFGREGQVVDRLVEIVNELDLDGVDIDYEYFYEDNQNGSGFRKGAEARKFLKDVTRGLRRRLPSNAVVTHAPMDVDVVKGTAYFDLLQEVKDDLDYLMPQYYNGVTRPVSEGIYGDRYLSAYDHLKDIAAGIFDGDATKVVFGFCINDCSFTGSNANGREAAKVMADLGDALKGEGCDTTGGAFFWVSKDDSNGSWSKPVREVLDSQTRRNRMLQSKARTRCVVEGGTNPVTTAPTKRPTKRPTSRPTEVPSVNPTPSPTRSPPTEAPTKAVSPPVSETSAPTATPPTDAPTDAPTETKSVTREEILHNCVPCYAGTSGPCQKFDGVCFRYQVEDTKTCFPGTYDCSSFQEPGST